MVYLEFDTKFGIQETQLSGKMFDPLCSVQYCQWLFRAPFSFLVQTFSHDLISK